MPRTGETRLFGVEAGWKMAAAQQHVVTVFFWKGVRGVVLRLAAMGD